jgi:hypothetical protein
MSASRPLRRFVLCTLLAGLCLPTTMAADAVAPSTSREAATTAIDAITFGDTTSEQGHGFATTRSDTLVGGLDQSARRILPSEDTSWRGGTLEWTMAVDPQTQNYLTVKLWGSDKGAASGRLVLFVDGLQAGYWREGDYDVISQCDEEALAPGRFVYVTLPLPPRLTNGKNQVRLMIAAFGPMWYYGQTWDKLQKPLTQPTRGVYRAYTHTTARFVPAAAEPQGAMPAAKTRTTPGPDVIAKTKDIVISRLNGYATAAKPVPAKLKGLLAELTLLAEAYTTEWTPTHRNSHVIDQIVRDGDALAASLAKDAKYLEPEWSGAGPLGKAIMLTWPDLQTRLDATITIGNTETTRRDAWTTLLRRSVDYWRTHRRSFTNQSMIVDLGIYSANRGLQLIAPDRALPEAQALRYLYESAGIEPWLGSDAPDQPIASNTPERDRPKPFGEHYCLVSRKGLSRELGYVGTYGETILTFVREMVTLTGDAKLREQLRRIQTARLYFRYPGVDDEGYRCMKMVSEIDNRTAHYPLPGGAYNAPNIRESWWMEVPALLRDDAQAVGVAQQAVEEGQYFAYVEGRLKDPDTLGMMRNVDEWAAVSALPPSAYRLPMTPGQPDTLFADEENAVLALKHRDTRLFINFYYRAERAVNRIARVFEQTPGITRIATVRTEVVVDDSGHTYERPDWTDHLRNKGLQPPGNALHQAWAGEKMPIAKRPDGATAPTYGEWGPFVGKASFYALRYGDYLIGMNTTEDRSIPLHIPADRIHTRAKDLVSGTTLNLDGDIQVAPLSTVVLDLSDTTETRTPGP